MLLELHERPQYLACIRRQTVGDYKMYEETINDTNTEARMNNSIYGGKPI
jgi:hypothetical protein